MMKRFNTIFIILSVLISSLFVSCDYNNEDAPPYEEFIEGELSTIAYVKSLYAEELAKYWTERVPVEITEDICIKGIIIGDDKTSNGNLYKEAYVQDETGGLRMTFLSTGGIYKNDSVTINLNGLYLSDYGDFIQLGGVPYFDDSNNYRLTGIDKHDYIKRTYVEGQVQEPTIITIDQAGENYMGMLVQFNDVQFADSQLGLTYAIPETDTQDAASANRTLVDCDGNSIIVRSSGYSSFAGTFLPEGKGTFVGIVTKFTSGSTTTIQIVIRSLDEIDLSGDRCSNEIDIILGDPVDTINEDFSSQTNNADINLTGWNNFVTAGSRTWRGKTYNSEIYAQATGYNSGEASIESWLMLPPVTANSAKTLSFESQFAYWEHLSGNMPMKVVYSTNYTGGDVNSASWTELDATIATDGVDAQNTWVESGSIALPTSNNPIVIAFIYNGSNTESTSMRIDNIVIN
nr:DUF5689 domain-containing protein [uncultured Carboxylicivirga sp.]